VITGRVTQPRLAERIDDYALLQMLQNGACIRVIPKPPGGSVVVMIVPGWPRRTPARVFAVLKQELKSSLKLFDRNERDKLGQLDETAKSISLCFTKRPLTNSANIQQTPIAVRLYTAPPHAPWLRG
jgi:hypothetical protein